MKLILWKYQQNQLKVTKLNKELIAKKKELVSYVGTMYHPALNQEGTSVPSVDEKGQEQQRVR